MQPLSMSRANYLECLTAYLIALATETSTSSLVKLPRGSPRRSKQPMPNQTA